MTQYLPPNLLALFAPRDPIPYLPPAAPLPWEKKHTAYQGVGAFLKHFEETHEPSVPTRVETRDEKRERKKKERQEQVAYKLEQDLALWDPSSDVHSTGTDPYKTLFVARINYDTSKNKLKREFEAYGPVKQINMVTNQKSGKPRGFAFIEFEHERDMHSAYKHADGKKIDGRRVLVDIERGRTIKGWRPRRLGGGLGGTRKGGPDVNTKFSGRDEASHLAREREEREKERERSRSRDRDTRRRRSRSPRERGDDRGGRGERRRRSRSREQQPARRRRSRSRERNRDEEDVKVERPRRPRRSRSRDRKRSRSRDRKRSRRSRSRSMERKPDKLMDLIPDENMGGMGGGGGPEDFEPVRIKQEPEDDYPEPADFPNYNENGGSMPQRLQPEEEQEQGYED